jgi:uncharacterized protein with PQ loop repeat
MLGVIMMIRIHAMYQQSKKMLVFLAVALLASTIASGVMTVMETMGISAEEYVIYGYYICIINLYPYQVALSYEALVPTAIWEILAFVLAIWIVIKHFHELRQSPTGPTIGDCFMVLTKSHAFYFLNFAIVACLSLGAVATDMMESPSTGSALYYSVFQISQVLQMLVLGPRLILSIRQYHAQLVDRSDEGTAMTSIHFQAGGDRLTGGDV